MKLFGVTALLALACGTAYAAEEDAKAEVAESHIERRGGYDYWVPPAPVKPAYQKPEKKPYYKPVKRPHGWKPTPPAPQPLYCVWGKVQFACNTWAVCSAPGCEFAKCYCNAQGQWTNCVKPAPPAAKPTVPVKPVAPAGCYYNGYVYPSGSWVPSVGKDCYSWSKCQCYNGALWNCYAPVLQKPAHKPQPKPVYKPKPDYGYGHAKPDYGYGHAKPDYGYGHAKPNKGYGQGGNAGNKGGADFIYG